MCSYETNSCLLVLVLFVLYILALAISKFSHKYKSDSLAPQI